VNPRDLVGRACPEISYLGGLFYFAPQTLARAAELGLSPSQFYFVGRAGVLGNVSAAVADSALGYFAPSVVVRHWDTASQVLPPSEIAAAYLECCRDFGRHYLGGEDWLGQFCAAAELVLNAASPVALPLFAAVKALPLADDLAAKAMQLVTFLREFRGGVHLMAIVASGLEPRVAHWLTRPDAWENFGYRPSDIPEVGEEHRESLMRADKLTDQLTVPAFSVLDESATEALLTGLEAMRFRLPLPEFPD
jgi:helix-turn-helix protein